MDLDLFSSDHLAHVIRFCADVVLQLYVFPRVPDDTVQKLKRRVVCRVLGTLIGIVIMHLVNKLGVRDWVWWCVIAACVYGAVQLHHKQKQIAMDL